MTPIPTLRIAGPVALLAGITALAVMPAPASAGSAVRPASASKPLALVGGTGATTLTLSNGTRVAVQPPRGAAVQPGLAGQARAFTSAQAGSVCFFGAAQSNRPQAAPAQQTVTKYTLSIKGVNLAGAPDNTDQVQVFSATSMKWNENNIGPVPQFHHGVATLQVPAGKYWLIGQFTTANSFRIDIPAQVTVTGNTTAAVSARAASSEVTATTPRPAVAADAVFDSSYTLRGGQTFEDCGVGTGAQLWVSPLPRMHTTGTLFSATSIQLNSPPAQARPYTYELDSAAPAGSIASQHLTVTAADLATEHEHFFSDAAATAPWLALGGPARQFGETGFLALSTLLPMPGDRTVYYQAQPDAVWRPETSGVLAQLPPWRLLHAGQQLSTNWNAYPLHPGTNLPPAGVSRPTLPSAVRAGNRLLIDITPFSDNTPGHTGSGLSRIDGIKGTGSYALYAGGVKVASGKLPGRLPFPDVGAGAKLGPKLSQIRFALTTSRQGTGANLSGTSTDSWTWPSRPEPHAVMLSPWYCGAAFVHGQVVYDHHCAAQDMMTLEYRLARESLGGVTPAGRQTLGIAVRHLPDAVPFPVTRARLQVSYDNGTSWQHATLTRVCHGQVCTNRYRASYTAPAGAQVSLRVTARDTQGATVTETILGAYLTH